jgi:hypothetical protein
MTNNLQNGVINPESWGNIGGLIHERVRRYVVDAGFCYASPRK